MTVIVNHGIYISGRMEVCEARHETIILRFQRYDSDSKLRDIYLWKNGIWKYFGYIL
jgi:hypothetical protein